MAIMFPAGPAGFFPRAYYGSFQTIDYAKIYTNIPKRPARSLQLSAAVFGLGFDLRVDQLLRLYTLSLGAHWLLQIAVGVRFNTQADYKDDPAYQDSLWLREAHHYIEVTLFMFALSLGKMGAAPWKLRGFFRHRRVF